MSTILTIQGAIAPHWQRTLLPATAAAITGLLATAIGGAQNVDEGEVCAAHELVGIEDERIGTMALDAVQRASLDNESALIAKRRLTAATLAWLLVSAVLIGALNVSGTIFT